MFLARKSGVTGYGRVIMLGVMMLFSCAKEQCLDKEIVIGCGADFSVETKATAVTSLPGTLYWGASTGSLGSESAKWSASAASVSSGQIRTGRYQTASPTSYNYYVASQSFSVGSSATMTVANNNTDVIAGCVTTSSASPSVTLGHIFARTGTLTCYTQSGYSIDSISWSIVGKSSVNGTAGTYSLSSGDWTASSATLGEVGISSSSDYYLIPGVYTIKVSYRLSVGAEYSQWFTKYGDVTLVQGKINNISCTAIGGDATTITFNVSIQNWSVTNTTFTWNGDRPY